MSLSDFIKSHSSYINSLLRYRRTYKNWKHVILKHVLNKYPIEGILKNGTMVKLLNSFDLYANSFNTNDIYKINEKEKSIIISIKEHKREIKFFSDGNFGGIFGHFFENNFLPDLKNKIVIDVGAFLCDSSIYFILKGAKKVIAIEPLPRNFELAQKNILENDFSDKIDLQLAGCGSKEGTIKVDEEKESTHQVNLRVSEGGKEIPIIGLDTIIKPYETEELVLKINCEGCEYDIILNSSNNSLRKFQYLVIEYHYGYKNLVKKLEKANFNVRITTPVFCYNADADISRMYIGMIYATRK